jgi:hypothetical protein
MVFTLDYRAVCGETLVKVFISARADFICKKVLIYVVCYVVCNVVASYFKWDEKMTRPYMLKVFSRSGEFIRDA